MKYLLLTTKMLQKVLDEKRSSYDFDDSTISSRFYTIKNLISDIFHLGDLCFRQWMTETYFRETIEKEYGSDITWMERDFINTIVDKATVYEKVEDKLNSKEPYNMLKLDCDILDIAINMVIDAESESNLVTIDRLYDLKQFITGFFNVSHNPNTESNVSINTFHFMLNSRFLKGCSLGFFENEYIKAVEALGGYYNPNFHEIATEMKSIESDDKECQMISLKELSDLLDTHERRSQNMLGESFVKGYRMALNHIRTDLNLHS